jgi:cytochrome c2
MMGTDKQERRHAMLRLVWVLLLTWFISGAALAQGGELADGEKQCAVCHGLVAGAKTGQNVPAPSPWPRVDLAMAPSSNQVAVALGYGPQLRGVIGRPAGTVEGFQYSDAFLAKLKGKVWDEAMLEQWIISSQTMVPGTFMFYSQKNADIRRRIIAYLREMQ